MNEQEAFEKWVNQDEPVFGMDKFTKMERLIAYTAWITSCQWQQAQDDELIQLLKTKLYKAEAENASPVIRDGMQLVPVRPTLAMVLATGFNEQESRDCYKAMINAYKEKQK